VHLLRLVVLERIEEEGRGLQNHVLGHEDVDNAFEVDEQPALVVHKLNGKFGFLFRARAHDMLQMPHCIVMDQAVSTLSPVHILIATPALRHRITALCMPRRRGSSMPEIVRSVNSCAR
jgi:hypothetical protein